MTEIKAAQEELILRLSGSGTVALCAVAIERPQGEGAPPVTEPAADAVVQPKADDVVEADYEIVDESKKS